MSFADDEEILEDFLVEAGEILEQLSDQLVQLERRPDDSNLLNAIFRGFHTVKGGAGFLQLGALVDCCHVTENLFDILRTGKREVSSELMDVVLQALDAVNAMFVQVRDRQELQPADPALITRLEALVSGEDPESGEPAVAVPATALSQDEPLAEAAVADLVSIESSGQHAGDEEITDEEFEALLDQLHGKNPQAFAPIAAEPLDSAGADSDEITDEEFEALLDQLHGSGTHQGVPVATEELSSKKPPVAAAEKAFGIAAVDKEAVGKESVGKESVGKESVGKETVDKEVVDREVVDREAVDREQGGKETAGTKTAGAGAVSTSAISSPRGSAQASNAGPADRAAGRTAAVQEVHQPAQETTVRVDTRRLDEIMNMVGELVLVRNRLVRLGMSSSDEVLSKAVSNLDLVTADLQTSVMKTRMQPIKKVFGRFPRVVRDLARNMKKEITLEMQGEDTDLDKNLVEALADPLVHLVRNSVDHGIEMPDEREKKGKPRQGTILLAAEQEGDHILLSISDDGNGMDPAALRRKAIEKGILDPDAAERLSDAESFDLIFAPGFSTKVEVSDVSGRGVGMDVVKTKISQLNGSVVIDSTPGQGSRIEIKVPLTLAIMPTLMVMLGGQTFALPLGSVNEIFNLDLNRTHIVDGQQVITVREKSLPLFHLRRWLVDSEEGDRQHEADVVIVTVGKQRIGLVVDSLIGQEEVVIKPLGRMLHGTPGMAGATITGDGQIAIILDVPGLLKRYAN